MNRSGPLAELALSQWQDTYATLHRWLQIVGKTRLALAPKQNHWWHSTLYVSTRGLRTSPMPYRDFTVEVELDFGEHQLNMHTSLGTAASIPLHAQSTSEFYCAYVDALHSIDLDVRIWPVPVELTDTLPFAEDVVHNSYDPEAARACWRALVHVDRALNEFRANFIGKCSPSHFWWGAFDMACTRFSGKTAPQHPGGIPNLPDYVAREAYSHECMSVGWWPGNVDGPVAKPAFYAYAYPEPAGFSSAAVNSDGAFYHPDLREWILPYDRVRASADPHRMMVEFFETAYAAAARLGGWPRDLVLEERR